MVCNIPWWEVKKVAFTLACRDTGTDCPFIARGETEDEMMKNLIVHAKEVHNYTDEQINDPEMMKKVKAAIKEE